MLFNVFGLLLFAASPVTASAVTASIHDGQDGQHAQARLTTTSLCVSGSSTARNGFTMHYQELKLPSIKSGNGLVVEPSWRSRHEIGDPSHYYAGTAQLPWAENKCQYTCNAMRGCVSFVGYRTIDSTPQDGQMFCHYFDSILVNAGIAARPPGDSPMITHAFNKLCR